MTQTRCYNPAMATTPTLVTAEQLLAMGPDSRFELVDGELVKTSPVGGKHSWLVVRLASWIYSFVDSRKLGVVGTELGFIMKRNPDLVRAPDISLVLQDNWGPANDDGFFEGAPALAVEVLSPDDRANQVQRKVREYFGAGSLWAWIVDPETESVIVHYADGRSYTFSGEQKVTGEDVLAGFSFLPAGLFRR